MAAADPDEAEFDGNDTVGLTSLTSRVLFGGAIQMARPDLVAQRLAEAISVGLLLDGERLPSEARLAQELGTGTATLRQALAHLRGQGLVETRRGRGGGTFVRTAAAANGRSRPVDRNGTEDGDLVHSHLLHERLVNFSVMELAGLNDLRQAISGTAAELAAERALADDHELLEHRLGRLSTAEGVSALRRADTQLSVAIAAAAQSSILADREMSLRAELGDLLWWQVDEAERAVALSERRKLVGAIEQGRAEVARKVCTRMVARETDRLVALRLARYRADAS